MRLVTSSEIQEMDRLTIQEVGIPGAVLMENAARGAARIFLEHFAPPRDSSLVVLCGRGNNGGDGYGVARYLRDAGLRVTVIVLAESDKISGDALLNLRIIRRLGIDILEVHRQEEWAGVQGIIEGCHYIIDGILGTGLNSPVKGFYRHVITEINGLGKPVTAIDIPSGLSADTGQIMGVAVRADLTVTFGFPKVGQLTFPGAGLVGRLVRVDIGIPRAVSEQIPETHRLTEPRDFRELLAPEPSDIHKGSRGHLLVLAGSVGKTGAATLTCLAALRAGAGLVTLGIPRSLNGIMEEKLTEAMTFPLPETTNGSISLKAEEEILRLLQGKSALALGPGLSTDEETASLIRRIVAAGPVPMVIDADGLNAISQDPGSLGHCRGRTVLTPHPGEMGMLTGFDTARIQADRIGITTDFSRRYGCILLLKGARTLIRGEDGPLYVNPTGNPSLASGGSGDVLTGLIGGFLARGRPPLEAAIAGAYLHGLAADLLAEKRGQVGILAGELLDFIPSVMTSLSGGGWPLAAPPLHRDLFMPL